MCVPPSAALVVAETETPASASPLASSTRPVSVTPRVTVTWARVRPFTATHGSLTAPRRRDLQLELLHEALDHQATLGVRRRGGEARRHPRHAPEAQARHRGALRVDEGDLEEGRHALERQRARLPRAGSPSQTGPARAPSPWTSTGAHQRGQGELALGVGARLEFAAAGVCHHLGASDGPPLGRRSELHAAVLHRLQTGQRSPAPASAGCVGPLAWEG